MNLEHEQGAAIGIDAKKKHSGAYIPTRSASVPIVSQCSLQTCLVSSSRDKVVSGVLIAKEH
jgi:hypothetical protein